jgi:glucose/mannose transport system permease protein
VLLAVLLDQKIRSEGALRTIYLYPMALSFVVTGTAWKWLLNPGLGIEKMVRDWGFPNFEFGWLVDTDMAIYCVVIAGIWQSAGFAMALFLAGLRGIDDSIIKAAQVDGASLPRIYWLVDTDMAIYCVVIAGIWQSAGFAMALFLAGLRGIDDSIIKAAQVDGASLPRIYWRIVLPALRPVFFSTLMVLSHLAIKSFDLVMALTAGGPGFATDVPATFMYTMSFSRGQIGLGAASATMMLATVAALVVPYLYSELRSKPHDR